MIDKNFMEAIRLHNFSDVRDMLKNRLLIDHNCTTGMFNECWAECEKAGIVNDLYETHDGRAIPSANTKENFEKLTGQLATNFSKERLDAVLRIMKVVFAAEQKYESKETNSSATKHTGHTSEERIVGERIIGERVIGERVIGEKREHTDNSQSNRNSQDSENNSNIGIVIVVAVAVVAIVAGVIMCS